MRISLSMAAAQPQPFFMHLQLMLLCYSHCSILNLVDVFKFYSRAVCWFLYSTSICNRSLYSTLLCKVIGVFQESGMLRSTLCVVKCPEVMDVNGHVVCFRRLQHLVLALYAVLPVFRTNCISDRF